MPGRTVETTARCRFERYSTNGALRANPTCSEGNSVLDQNNHQGKFGADYVRVLASAAGLIWSQDDVDLDAVDLCLKLPGRTPRGFSPRIDAQVK
jgi:hypothetical protein